jgi:hypothetical protein
VGWEDEAAALTAAIADDDDLMPAIVARVLAGTHRAILGAALTGADRDGLRATADRAYDQLAAGLGDYGKLTAG